MVCSQKGILVSNTKEQTTNTRNNINTSPKYYAEWKETQGCTVWFHLYKVLDQVKLSYGQRNLKSGCFSSSRGLTEEGMGEFSWGDENVLHLLWWSDYTSGYKSQSSWNYRLKIFATCILSLVSYTSLRWL